MLEVAAEANKRDMEATIAAGKTAREDLVKMGVKFHAFPEADRQQWRAVLPDFFADFISNQEKAGKGADARKMVAIWKEVVETVK
jgi:TRAP-type C4-dicarboxylate transport system substrate-binding protein